MTDGLESLLPEPVNPTCGPNERLTSCSLPLECQDTCHFVISNLAAGINSVKTPDDTTSFTATAPPTDYMNNKQTYTKRKLRKIKHVPGYNFNKDTLGICQRKTCSKSKVCVCQPGFIRASSSNTTCVPAQECKSSLEYCGPNEYFTNCGTYWG